MTPASFRALLPLLQDLHRTHAELARFTPFPGDLEPQPMPAKHRPAADLMRDDPGLHTKSTPLAAIAQSFITAGQDALWRQTYEDTDINQDFLTRFGCYGIIGRGGAWDSQQMAGFLVYMPANLHYPWHQHPAEELYIVLAGEGLFEIQGQPAKTLRAGDSIFHASDLPHALTTRDHPILAYVTWRNCLETPPRWAQEAQLA